MKTGKNHRHYCVTDGSEFLSEKITFCFSFTDHLKSHVLSLDVTGVVEKQKWKKIKNTRRPRERTSFDYSGRICAV